MKKRLFLLPLFAGFVLSGCELQWPLINNFKNSSEEQKENKENEKQNEEQNNNESGDQTQPTEEIKLVIDYQHVGGAQIPESWDDDDTAETTRNASYEVNKQTFTIDFVGKWRISNNNEELQTKKDPVSYIRSTSSLIVKRMVIECFMADVEVYLTTNHTGDKLTGKEVSAEHNDGEALEYTVNSANFSLFAKETYKGSAINIYSISLYF